MLATGYKLVRSSENSSMIVVSGIYTLYYKTGKVTKAIPNTLGIMIFKDIDSVRKFIDRLLTNINWRYISLLEVIYDTDSSTCDPDIRISTFTFTEDLYDFYNIFPEHTMPIPEGTVCCQEVYVSREILTGDKLGGDVC